ncbi:MAG TPA: 50S ribosomal protein L4 [Bacillota bacterium]|nr:50S ribosomal protein L4 [Bacillota bacterium]
MPKLALLNQQGESVGNINLNDAVFAVENNDQVIYDVVKQQRAAMRQGTAQAKTRAEVRGGGRKPYRQKGTGHARQGTIRAPHYTGGGIVFGPTPRDYDYKVNRKVRRLALKIVLSDKVRQNNLIAVDALVLASHKTKDMVTVMNSLKAEGKVMVITDDVNELVEIASRNIPNLVTVTYNHVSVYDILNTNQIIATESALKKIEEVLS